MSEVNGNGARLVERIDQLIRELTEIRDEVTALSESSSETPVDPTIEEVTEEATSPESDETTPIVVDEELEEKVPELTLETAFEPMVDFHTAGQLSVADSFFFANELFGGNRPELNRVLSEIDRLSSVSQMRHYLTETLDLNVESDEGKRFYDFVLSCSTRR
ncbi:MAG: hypothetical protein SPI16_05890 [Porphyromonas sp.]|uniref:hypothetical protein n=1 Tax=Porphyromonas sp. TaxID=1924944 RepID=UPI002A91544A|nr:hypothetical protein [Porphyromonas sp.]MDD7469071.1 hypothetical protein [Bacteroidales bacterium]MDY6102561.1 hypothetical protein [Porphyromonas sp.]